MDLLLLLLINPCAELHKFVIHTPRQVSLKVFNILQMQTLTGLGQLHWTAASSKK
jgi:hypothetical protein